MLLESSSVSLQRQLKPQSLECPEWGQVQKCPLPRITWGLCVLQLLHSGGLRQMSPTSADPTEPLPSLFTFPHGGCLPGETFLLTLESVFGQRNWACSAVPSPAAVSFLAAYGLLMTVRNQLGLRIRILMAPQPSSAALWVGCEACSWYQVHTENPKQGLSRASTPW